jgi:hypothetical protein
VDPVQASQVRSDEVQRLAVVGGRDLKGFGGSEGFAVPAAPA